MKTPTLYLDDARIGRFRPLAKEFHNEFLESVAEAPSSQAVLDLVLGSSHDSRLNRLGWQGIGGLRSLVGQLLGDVPQSQVFLGSRTRSLMSMAATMLSRWTSHCLVMDNGWNLYQEDLFRAFTERRGKLSGLAIQQQVMEGQWEVSQLCDYVCWQCERLRCDSVYLTAVDSFGVRLPIAQLCKRLRDECSVRLIVVDACQALGQVDCRTDFADADLVIAGTHKWVGSYFPLAVAVASSDHSYGRIQQFFSNWCRSSASSDQLTHFDESIKLGREPNAPETVNLACLLAGFGALKSVQNDGLSDRAVNRCRIQEVSQLAGWQSLPIGSKYRSNILMLQPMLELPRRIGQMSTATPLRKILADSGLVASTYNQPFIRISIPNEELSTDQLAVLERSLRKASAFIESIIGSQSCCQSPWVMADSVLATNNLSLT